MWMDVVHNIFRRIPAIMKVVQIICQAAEIRIPFIFDNVGANTFTLEEENAMLNVIRSKFGQDVRSQDLEVVGCGTIGRVFKYKDYALKVKIPGVLERIERDLTRIENVAWLIDTITLYRFFLHRKVRTVHESICKQNDFQHELQNAMTYTNEMKKYGVDETCIFVPTFFPELSCDDMVVMSFVHGRTLTSIPNPSSVVSARTCDELHKYIVYNLTLFRICHADLHVGNMIVEQDCRRLAIIDFGMCVPRLPTKKIIVLLKMLHASHKNDAIALSRLIALEYFVDNDPKQCVIDNPELYKEMEFEIVRAFHQAFDQTDLHKVREVFRAAATWSLPRNVWGSREMADVEVAAIVSLTNLLSVGIQKELVLKYAKQVMEIEGVD